ncbi:MAG: amidase [Vicinamibacterales bacterium]|jgi:amidase|nr:amidase [Vicinamibacterales bacterium]MDP6607658.1 amidase [Vicinamibacterales bacterium]HAK54760.1 amidase [Acidobacteriota bacterium]|tara:strand:+ start:19721 stop:21142 length:1422 start_codon:yes stop_codon:yes gene_type:complete
MSESSLCFATATDLAGRIATRDVSAREVMAAHLAQIARVNPKLNAIVTLVADQAMAAAGVADEALARDEPTGPLHGLPVAHKDLIPTRGIRTTYGSRLFADHVPEEDSLIVDRLKAAGAITIGKTNTPEFGAGSQTFNAVFGATRNPYDPTKTCGGSSGGSAVALATSMTPLADGTDHGGSLRNPAGFCNVVGLRPSPGRVPVWPATAPGYRLDVQGPMGRTVQDVALMLSVIAGPDPRSPIALAEPGASFRQSLTRDFHETRIAWSPTLGGLPVDRRVAAVVDTGRAALEVLGCRVDEAEPDLTDADEIFRVWRAWHYDLALGDLLDAHRDQLKDTVVWNIEEGRRLEPQRIGRATRAWTALDRRIRDFFDRFAFLALPVSQVPPFDIDLPYVTEIDGVRLDTYLDWMRSCYLISVTGLPAISVPCGFTDDGLPVGLQIVGGPGEDFSLLQLAYAFEEATGVGKRRPAIAQA